jgi:Family of unknown function (DUF6055)
VSVALVCALPATASADTRTICPQGIPIDAAMSAVGTTTFLIHYDPTLPNANATAMQLGNDAEAGRSLELTQLGFPGPLSDAGVTGTGVSNPDARTDIYLYPDGPCPPLSITATCSCNGFMAHDSGRNTGWIYINPAAVTNKSSIAHEFFHTIQLGIAGQNAFDDTRPMFHEASASWAGALACQCDGGHLPLYTRGTGAGQTLDCAGCTGETPYGQWPWFELVNEHIGPQAILQFFQRAASPGGEQLTWMNDVLTVRGTSLGAAVADYAATKNAADWSSPMLAGRFPLYQSNAPLGVVTNTSTNQTATLDHLATRQFELTSNACSGQCEATLHLDLGWPAGSGVQASLVRLGSSPGTRLPITSGASGAHADLPFNLGTQYAVALTNPSLTANAVPVSLNANATRNDSGTNPPSNPPAQPPAKPPATPAVPAIQLTGKAKVTRKRASRVLSLSLNSSAAGFVVVTLTPPGAKLAAHTAAKATRYSRTFALKAGANKISVALPKRVRKGRYALTLTPQASDRTPGSAVSAGRLSVPKPPKVKKRRARYVI